MLVWVPAKPGILMAFRSIETACPQNRLNFFPFVGVLVFGCSCCKERPTSCEKPSSRARTLHAVP